MIVDEEVDRQEVRTGIRPTRVGLQGTGAGLPWRAMAATLERRTGIVTPEAVVLEFETAGVASRLLARLIDGVVLWVGAIAALLGFGAVFADAAGQAIAVIFSVLVVFFMVFGYWILFETVLRGRTLGKMAMGLRVVTAEGAPVRFRHSAVRAIVGVVDFLLPPLGPVAVVSVLLSPDNQRLGDLAAGTIVLRERVATGPAVALRLSAPPGREALVGALELGRLTDAQYGVVRRFLLRAHTLDPNARRHLASELAGGVARTSGVARPADLDPEWYLHAAGLAYQRRTGGVIAPAVDSQPAPPSGPPVGTGGPPPPPQPVS